MNKADILNEVMDEVYSQYESDHSLRSVIYIHPMFYNGTFSENNSYQPDKPEELLTKEEFINKIDEDITSRWSTAASVLFHYILKQNGNRKL